MNSLFDNIIMLLIPSNSRGLKLLLIVGKSFCITENFINLRQAFSINNLLNVNSRDELREWLMQNHDKEPECWVW